MMEPFEELLRSTCLAFNDRHSQSEWLFFDEGESEDAGKTATTFYCALVQNGISIASEKYRVINSELIDNKALGKQKIIIQMRRRLVFNIMLYGIQDITKKIKKPT
jgi:hypothetical protein